MSAHCVSTEKQSEGSQTGRRCGTGDVEGDGKGEEEEVREDAGVAWVKLTRYNRKRSNLLLISEARLLLHGPFGCAERRTDELLATSSLPRVELNQKRLIITQPAAPHHYTHTHQALFSSAEITD